MTQAQTHFEHDFEAWHVVRPEINPAGENDR